MSEYRRGPISFSKAEADMIAELIALYPVALESEEPRRHCGHCDESLLCRN